MNDKKNVVIIKDTKGNTCFVAYISCLNKNEINKAFNENFKYQQEQEEEKKSLLSTIANLKCRVDRLELDIKLDRGEITKEQYDEEISKYGE